MAKINYLKRHLNEGQVYRRETLSKWSRAVDRHVGELVHEGILQRVGPGLYYFPKESVFGKVPPGDKELIEGFLKDNRFLITSPNDYNDLGVGTTQLYNKRVVYNHKRHGEIRLGNRNFSFRIKPFFPKKLTIEFLLVDLVNNLTSLSEDTDAILKQIALKIRSMDRKKLASALAKYGSVRAKKILSQMLID